MISAKEARKIQLEALAKEESITTKQINGIMPTIEKQILEDSSAGKYFSRIDVSELSEKSIAELRYKIQEQGYETTIYKNSLSISWTNEQKD